MLIASVAALGFGTASAVAVPRSEGTVRYAQLRLYGESGCSAKNLGELGIYNGDINKCHTFGDDVIKSIDYEYSYKEGCSRECNLVQSSPFIILAIS